MTGNLLHIDASARQTDSVTRMLSARAVERLAPANVTYRDLAADPLPQVTEAWVGANFTPDDARSDEQRALLNQSDALVDELIAADTVVIGLPIYNFGVPAAFKAWIDLITRVGRTFNYTEDGPVGKLADKRVIIALASGGTKLGSEMDFVSPYVRLVMGFNGLTDVEFIAADQLAMDAEATIGAAQAKVDALAA